MNILHVLSGNFVTGAETSTAAVIERQVARGHRVFIASGAFPHATKALWVKVPIYDRRPFSRLANILALARLARREEIDLMHAHSRAASWVSHWAAKLTGRAYLSTLHGRQHLHFSNIHFNVYGRFAAAVCEDIRDQMLSQTRVFQPERLRVIRNGIPL